MKKFCILIIAVFVSFSSLFAQGGQPTIESLNDQIARAEEEIRRNEALLGKIQGERVVTQNELKLILSRITSRQDIISSLNQQIRICERNITKKNNEITAINRQIDTLKQEYADMIYAAYKNYLVNNSMAFLFAARDFQEMSLRINYMKRYNMMREEKAQELNALTALLQEEIDKLDAELVQLEASRKSRDRELTALQGDEKTYKQSSSRLEADERRVAEEIRKKEREKQNAQKQLQRLVEEEARRREGRTLTEAEARANIELSNNFEQNEGKFPYPVHGGIIVDRFGRHPHPTQRGLIVDNKGVNIAGEKGADVKCIFEGTVSRVVFIKGLNNCVMVNHGDYYTVYSNLSEVYVKANDSVYRNQVIGKLPSSDSNDDWYLHFELWKGTTFLNPEKWLLH